jgi:hypothetical protein
MDADSAARARARSSIVVVVDSGPGEAAAVEGELEGIGLPVIAAGEPLDGYPVQLEPRPDAERDHATAAETTATAIFGDR